MCITHLSLWSRRCSSTLAIRLLPTNQCRGCSGWLETAAVKPACLTLLCWTRFASNGTPKLRETVAVNSDYAQRAAGWRWLYLPPRKSLLLWPQASNSDTTRRRKLPLIGVRTVLQHGSAQHNTPDLQSFSVECIPGFSVCFVLSVSFCGWNFRKSPDFCINVVTVFGTHKSCPFSCGLYR